MPAVKSMLMKTKWYPRIHNLNISWGHGLETGVVNQATIIPLTMYDEGLGDPAGQNTNPEHASFVENAMPNCFPESRINLVDISLTMILNKGAIETDKIHALKFAYMPIFTTFDDQIANDEVSGLNIGEILELQTESTDRQAFPLFNAVDMEAGLFAAVSTLHANVPGLT